MADITRPPRFTLGGPMWDKGADCSPILRSLPNWFGIEAAVVNYIAEIDRLPTWLAFHQEQAVGFLSIKQHYAFSAELYVMGVRREWQWRGIGSSLLVEAQAWLVKQGVEYLQVKTLGPSNRDKNYAKTRAFYEKMGFRPLEEFSQIWDEHNPCLILVKRL